MDEEALSSQLSAFSLMKNKTTETRRARIIKGKILILIMIYINLEIIRDYNLIQTIFQINLKKTKFFLDKQISIYICVFQTDS